MRYLVNEENTGFTKGYNRAIKFARGEQVLMLNSDIECLEESLSKISQASQSHNNEAVVAGRLYFPDLTDQDSVFYLPTIWGAFKEYFLALKGSYFMYLPKAEKDAVRVEGAVMACFLIPRKVLDKAGYLTERTFIFFEDVEYCRRLKQLGISVYFHPEAKFIHHHGASTKQLGDQAYQKLIKASKYYHGGFKYYLLTAVLWAGQKFNRVQTPLPRD